MGGGRGDSPVKAQPAEMSGERPPRAERCRINGLRVDPAAFGMAGLGAWLQVCKTRCSPVPGLPPSRNWS